MRRKRDPHQPTKVYEVLGLTCPGCQFKPIRSTWLEPCDKCDNRVCLVCREQGCKCTEIVRTTT